MLYGTRTVKESYFNGEVHKKVLMSVPIKISDKTQALSEIMKAMDLITTHQTHELTLTIKTDKDHKLTLLTKCYEVVEK
jgi:hypothetical protein